MILKDQFFPEFFIKIFKRNLRKIEKFSKKSFFEEKNYAWKNILFSKIFENHFSENEILKIGYWQLGYDYFLANFKSL